MPSACERAPFGEASKSFWISSANATGFFRSGSGSSVETRNVALTEVVSIAHIKTPNLMPLGGNISGRQGLAIVVMGVSGAGKSTVGELLAQALQCPFYDADAFHSKENKEKMSNGVALTDTDRAPWLDTLADILAVHLAKGELAVLACSALRPAYRVVLRQSQHVLEDDELTSCVLSKVEQSQRANPSESKRADGKKVDKTPKAKFSDALNHENAACGTTDQPAGAGEIETTGANKGGSRLEHGGDSCSSSSLSVSERPVNSHEGRRRIIVFVHLAGSADLFLSRVSARHIEGVHYMHPSLLQSQMDTLHIEPSEEDVIHVDAAKRPDDIVSDILQSLKLMDSTTC